MPPDRRPREDSRRDEARRDAALLLDMLLAAEDAQGFVAGMDEAAFLASALHQSAVIRQIIELGGGRRQVDYRLTGRANEGGARLRFDGQGDIPIPKQLLDLAK